MPFTRKTLAASCFSWLIVSLLSAAPNFPHIGQIERHDPALDALIDSDAPIEVLASGFEWSEGPAWDQANQQILFSDVPTNRIYAWSEKAGLSVYMEPSGYTGVTPRSNGKGSNGLTFDLQGRLLLCEHGDRRVAAMAPGEGKFTVTDHVDGKRFNSPNDLAIDSHGNIFFTDPIYGLPGGRDDPRRELDFCGVFVHDASTGKTRVVIDDLPMPNGVTISPDEKTLYVAQSDRDMPVIMAYPLNRALTVGPGRLLFDCRPLGADLRKNRPDWPVQNPDGIKTDAHGNIWFGGPGGIVIISPEGTHLGTISNGERMANLTWGGPDGDVLYITSDMYLARVQTKVVGRSFALVNGR